MQVVIDIPKEMYKSALNGYLCGSETLVNAIKNGIPLPKGHGKIISEPTEEDIAKTVGGQNDFSECIKDAVKAVFDNAPTIVEADRQEKSYGVYEVYIWDDVTYELIEKYETRAEAEARAAAEKQKNREAFKPSEEMPTSPYSYAVLSNTEYCNLMGNNA